MFPITIIVLSQQLSAGVSHTQTKFRILRLFEGLRIISKNIKYVTTHFFSGILHMNIQHFKIFNVILVKINCKLTAKSTDQTATHDHDGAS